MQKTGRSGATVSARRKTALILCGGWEGHTPRACADLFAPWLVARGFRVRVAGTLDAYTDRRLMRCVSLIVPIWTMGEISPEQWAGLRDAILAGAGVAGWHGGMCDAFRTNTEYQFMTGGKWVAHPGGVIAYRVRIVKPSDPVVKGLKDFRMVSEQYYMHTDPGNDVLATTAFSGRHGGMPWIKGTVMPYVWKRRFGRGRIFYSAFGHVAGDFEVPEALEIVKRGMLWAAGEPVTREYVSP